MAYQQRLFFLAVAWLVSSSLFSGCAGPLVTTDLQTLQQHPEQFTGKQVIIAASLEEVVANPKAYIGKKVQITSWVVRTRFSGPPDWNFLLTNNQDAALHCYERTYRYDAWIQPVMAIKRAEAAKGEVTVVGNLEHDLEIELDWFDYDGQHYDTDRLPAAVPSWPII